MESISLSEVSQVQKDKYILHDLTLVLNMEKLRIECWLPETWRSREDGKMGKGLISGYSLTNSQMV